MFDMSEVDTHAIVSRMMAKDELAAAWDQPSGSIAMHGVEPTRLQSLALQFAERAATFVENNERLFDARTGGHAFADNDKEKQRERERGSGAPKLRGPKVVRGGNASSNYAARSGGGGGASAGAGNQRRAAAGGNNSKPVGAAQQGATSGGNKQASNSK
jgi:translation initiation factor 3 subunit C